MQVKVSNLEEDCKVMQDTIEENMQEYKKFST
jgi:hypothetical protein